MGESSSTKKGMTPNPSRRNGAHLKSKTTPSQTIGDLTAPGTWMTYAEVCALLGESRHTVNKWRARPEVGFPLARVKPNRQLLFLRTEVAAFMSNLAVAA